MSTEQKIIVYAISAALAAVLSSVSYNVYDSTVKSRNYRSCVEANKEMAELITSRGSERLHVTSLPSCYYR